MNEDELIQAEIDRLILEGAMTPDHLDEDNDMIYTFDMARLKEVNPELYAEQMREVEESVEQLVDMGLLEGTAVDEHGDIVYNLTEQGSEFFREYFQQ
jgi:hypothetical protein